MRLRTAILAVGLGLAAVACLAFWQTRPARSADPRDNAAAERSALALLAEPRFQPPPGWRWNRFANADGAQLRYGWSRARGDVHGTIVILPGFQAPIEDFFETARDYLARGFDIWSLDARGQGGSDRWLGNPQKAYSRGLEHDARDLVQFVTKYVRPNARGPIFIVAQSLGGHIALRALHDHGDLAQALVMSSPAISFRAGVLTQKLPSWLLQVAARVAVWTGFGTAYAVHDGDWQFSADAGGAADAAKDDRARALAGEAWLLRNPSLREGGMTWAFVDERFRSSAIELSPGWLDAIATPVLVGTALDDALTDVSTTIAACAAMRRCSLLAFSHAKHALFGNSDATRAPFIEASAQFLLAQARAGLALTQTAEIPARPSHLVPAPDIHANNTTRGVRFRTGIGHDDR